MPVSVTEMTRFSHRGREISAISASTLLVRLAAAALGPGERRARRAGGVPWPGSVRSRRACLSWKFCEWVTTTRRSWPKTTLVVSKATESDEALGVDCLVAALGHRHQVEVVRRGHRTDEMERARRR